MMSDNRGGARPKRKLASQVHQPMLVSIHVPPGDSCSAEYSKQPPDSNKKYYLRNTTYDTFFLTNHQTKRYFTCKSNLKYKIIHRSSYPKNIFTNRLHLSHLPFRY